MVSHTGRLRGSRSLAGKGSARTMDGLYGELAPSSGDMGYYSQNIWAPSKHFPHLP